MSSVLGTWRGLFSKSTPPPPTPTPGPAAEHRSGSIRLPKNRQFSWSDPEQYGKVAELMSLSGYGPTTGSTSTRLKFSAVFACNDRICKDIASLPFRPLLRTDQGQQVARDHHQYFISKSPNPAMRKYMYMYTLNSHTNLYGNGFSPISRQNGRPISYGIWHPVTVRSYISPEGRLYWVNKGLKDSNGDYYVMADHDMIHTMWFSEDGINGKSVISFAKDSIDLGLSATRMMAENYDKAIHAPYYLSLREILTPEQREFLEQSMSEMGGPENGELEVFDNGGEFKSYPFATKDIETLNSRELTVRDVCRFMGVPGSKIGLREANVSYNSLEQENIAYVQDTLTPRCVHIEEEFDAKALAGDDAEDIRFKFELKSRLRGDSAARAAFYREGLSGPAPWLTINDVRELEDMDTIGPIGDKRYTNPGTITLDDVAAGKTLPDVGKEDSKEDSKQKLFESLAKNGNGNGKADHILQHES